MHAHFRWALLVALVAIALSGIGVSVEAVATYGEASKPSQPISEQQAVADAMKLLPASGAGYQVTATELEPTSKHFFFSGSNGEGHGEDEVKECVVIPPLPPPAFLPQCRYYPLWVLTLSNNTCDVYIAINALTGRINTGGGEYRRDAKPTSAISETCGISPGARAIAPSWWKPVWE